VSLEWKNQLDSLMSAIVPSWLTASSRDGALKLVESLIGGRNEELSRAVIKSISDRDITPAEAASMLSSVLKVAFGSQLINNSLIKDLLGRLEDGELVEN
jgi:hypothetical protein